MKRAELIIGKAYYMSESANWRDKHYSAYSSYAKTAERSQRYKVTVIETQLKTEQERNYRSRDVLIQNSEGKEKWVALNHIRCTWVEAVKVLTEDNRQRYGYDDRANKYARHMARKMQKEQVDPAIKALCEEIERVTGERVWRGDKIEGLELNTLLTLTKALSFIKTDLQAVAS